MQKMLGYVCIQCDLLAYNSFHGPSSDDENAEQIVSRHIGLLHRYNEAKDAAQVRNLASSGPPVILTVDGADPHREGESSSLCSSQ